MSNGFRIKFSRRGFVARFAGMLSAIRPAISASQTPAAPSEKNVPNQEFEYIVVGSGAGGGTVAARLANLGHTVLVLEAGGDPFTESGGNEINPDTNTLPEDYQVPAFHPNATENDAMKWEFFVRHYQDTARQAKDPKYCSTYKGKPVDGVLYPRAGTLGGCTAHNAMILVYPHNDDWDRIAKTTNDPSWSASNMRRYFERLENCRYRPIERFLHFLLRINPWRHGFSGWLSTEKGLPVAAALGDHELSKAVLHSAIEGLKQAGNPLQQAINDAEGLFDPNDWHYVKRNATGVRFTPLTTSNHARTGTRERLREVEKQSGGRLRIETHALATKVIFDGQRAVGVEYLSGAKLYQPFGTPSGNWTPRYVRATAEVILCGGAFNTPQLLMLSGIGPADQLSANKITPVKVLEGVGRNLQDRYEIGVTYKLDKPLRILEGAEFRKGDAPWTNWAKTRGGIYQSNGAVLAVIEKSSQKRPLPDLCCFCLTGDFRGYYPGYSKRFPLEKQQLTWAVLKAHTENRAGRVTLRSTDPREAPSIVFHYFAEGSDTAGEDLDSVVQGVELVRKLVGGLSFMTEEFPGKDVTGDRLREFIQNNAWGHHASCTCAIGDEASGGVVDSNFRVHGVTGLRIVDASVFPRIPGFFIVSSIYMIGEKAADVIHQASKSGAS